MKKFVVIVLRHKRLTGYFSTHAKEELVLVKVADRIVFQKETITPPPSSYMDDPL